MNNMQTPQEQQTRKDSRLHKKDEDLERVDYTVLGEDRWICASVKHVYIFHCYPLMQGQRQY